MLQFLRKHQKILFIVVTVAIVVSFCFFGTYGAMSGPQLGEDREWSQGISGQAIMERDLNSMCRLIGSSAFDSHQKQMPNLLNDGVIEKDFLSSGLSVILAKQYFAQLKPDLDQRAKKVKNYRPYVHPQAPQISVEGIWSRFAPAFAERFKMLKSKSDQSTAETFALFTQIYLEQVMLPAETMKQILGMQQQQFGAAHDPMLHEADFSLFGFHSIEDWFGPKFISLVGQFILNAAQMAEDRGYSVKREEIRSNLFQNIYQGYAQISRKGTLSAEDAQNYYQTAMRNLGMDEDALLDTWGKVMLCRRLFDDVGASVILDPLSFQQFTQFAKESVEVDLFELPSALQFPDFRSMLKFQVYLDAVSSVDQRGKIDLIPSRSFANLEQIEKRVPELVEREYELEWSTVNLNELASGISLKETWDWETKDPHWNLIKNNFSEIAGSTAQKKQERLTALDLIDKKVRAKIDQFARKKIMESRPDQIQLALQNASTTSQHVGIRLKGGAIPFKGVVDQGHLVSLLERAPLESESPNGLREQLHYFTGDGENYYRIQVLKRAPEKRVLLFAQASRDGTLDKLLDKKLEAAYPEVRKKSPHLFQQSGGQFRPFAEVKDKIGKILFSDLLVAIEETYRSQYGMLLGNAGDLPLQFYSNARALAFMQEAKRHLQLNPDNEYWIQTEGFPSSLDSQWKLTKSIKKIERATPLAFSKTELFALENNQWSSIHVGERGAVAFCRMISRSSCPETSIGSMDQVYHVLAVDAKRDLMQRILEKMAQRKVVRFSEGGNEL